MIHRVRHRRTFEQLRLDGSRHRSSVVSMTFLPMDLTHPQLAFAVPTSFGTAVQRQRARRRCRAAFGRAWNETDTPPMGVFLLRPSRRCLEMPFEDLTAAIEHTFGRLR